MNELGRHLLSLIRTDGPIPIARFMSEALIHPRYGYYMHQDPFGLKGDFITSPEISQVFGELIGLWCADCWALMGRPAALRLVEFGPGRGTLMADAWHAGGVQPGFQEATEVHLVEVSTALRARQQATLAKAAPGTRISWHDRFATVPAGPLLVIANEFFDALPIHQYQRTLTGWRERLVGATPGGESFRLMLASEAVGPPTVIPEPLHGAPLGGVMELCPAADAVMREIADRLIAYGGAAVIIDYGRSETGPRETLQAVRGHKGHPVLDEPGTADLCAHVDFAALADAATTTGARAYRPIEQGVFLKALGIDARTARLSARTDEERRHAIESGTKRLTDPAQMGALFKVLVVTDPGLPPPAAVEAEWHEPIHA
jgi:NADH dehydrogenase [ubiquinone] 1 alpha subcomplex assembly factor 7